MKPNTEKEPPQHEFSIPSREELLAILKKAGKPLNSREIADACDMPAPDERRAIRRRLKAMVRDGQIIRNRRGGYGLVDKMDLVAGKVIGHPDGFGFLVPDEGDEDIYLPAGVMRSLLHGDRAVVRISEGNRKGKYEGTLVEVLERANDSVVGRYFREKNLGFVIPDNKRLHHDILIPPGAEKNAGQGEFVMVKLTRQPDRHTQPVGRITEVIGSHINPGIATEVAIRAYDLPHKWPKEIKPEIRSLDPDRIEIPPGRKDLRDLPFVTIDGEDARDFDDAVCCIRKDGKWLLYVAIADVSYYVKPDTALDREAQSRGTSVYFPDRVIPMLPEILSNELCSLKPEVDRLSVICELQLSKSGKVSQSRFIEGVIRSSARLTYDKAAKIMVDKDKALRRDYGDLALHLDNLYGLYLRMNKWRKKAGLLDFDSRESQIYFDKKGNISSIQPVIRNDAHRLIEEFMLAANIAAAEFLLNNRIHCLYRNHPSPKQEKLDDVREFLAAFGLKLQGGDKPTAKDYAHLMDGIRNRPDRHLIQTVLLRSMPLASYSEQNLGHFGLKFAAYTHFTSPIRRYPDLLVHRAICKKISGSRSYPYNREQIHELGIHCSMTERRAEEASRDVIQRLKCEYMKNRIGETYSGTVTGVTGFGLFVELKDIYVEGLIHVTSLPRDYYHHDPIHHTLRGERTGRTYRLAQQLEVRLIRVDTDESKIDFEISKRALS